MPTSAIDGTVEEITLKWARRGVSLFDSIRFRLADGSEKTVTKAVVKQEVADELTPGAKGRFYIFKAFDIGGVHGVRLPDGRAVYAFPGNNEKIFLILGVVSVLWIALRLFGFGEVPVLAVLFLILAGVGWHLMSKGRIEARKQFDGDAG